MQTFLPYSDFKASAECLDKKRCWKQVVETSQILNVLKMSREGTPSEKKKIGWLNHPAVRMWVGYELALQVYYNSFWDVCVNNWKIKVEKLQRIVFEKKDFLYEVPKWLGYESLHASHRGNLIRKDNEYRKFGWDDSPELPYLWPVDKDGKLDYNIEEWSKTRKTEAI